MDWVTECSRGVESKRFYGSDEQRMFNIGYTAGISILLIVWFSIFVAAQAAGDPFPVTRLCLGELSGPERFTNAPVVIGMTFLFLGLIYAFLIRKEQM